MSLSNHRGRTASVSALYGGATTLRPAVLSIVKLLFVALANLPFLRAAPLTSRSSSVSVLDEVDGKDPEDPSLYAYLGTAVALVLLGGAFAGLTIALMGQDEIYLQVIAESGEGSEKKNAGRVLKLLKKGKHWVLVTLLLSNVITNETLPIVLDRSLGGGWPAVLSSTVLIVIFGEIAPQSVCVRYGLPIGAFMSPFVLALMWIMAPAAWPTAKLLDWLLGEDHGTTYKKAGLKTLVTLHKTLGTTGERLNQDEVTIISAVLDLKDKPVGDIMTPMQDVFTMSADTVLDEKMMDTILSQGYSRIPIYAPDNHRNFIGMLLVKILITYDPEDCMKVRDFALATLPETAPDTSCLDIVNFFQEGKSHMVLVSDFPGQDKGALGVVTLEDVIEELIGEEIIDESDVFIDIHKAIRRGAPAPRMKYSKPRGAEEDVEENEAEVADERTRLLSPREDSTSVAGTRKSSVSEPQPGRETTFMMRRRSSQGSNKDVLKPLPVRSSTQDMRQHLKHLGPSNVASRPRTTRYSSVKIKPGVGTIPENRQVSSPAPDTMSDRPETPTTVSGVISNPAPEGGEGTGLLNTAGKDASDAVIAVANGYGTMTSTPARNRDDENREVSEQSENSHHMTAAEASAFASRNASPSTSRMHKPNEEAKDDEQKEEEEPPRPEKLVVEHNGTSRPVSRNRSQSSASTGSHSTVGEMEGPRRPGKARRTARSGSITETHIDVGGMKKVVLQPTSSSDTEEGDKAVEETNGAEDKGEEDANGEGEGAKEEQSGGKKKKRKKRAGKKFRNKDSRSTSGNTSPMPQDE